MFDLGYYDYAWWAKLDAADCRIVTRLKSNTPLGSVREQKLASGTRLLYDHIGFLPGRQAKSRKNPMQAAVREIGVVTETGHKLRVVTNDLDAPADEIAGLYKRRRQIELFFRFVKQTLKIRHFLGRSENAVRTQVAIALLAFLLLHLLRKLTKDNHGPFELARLVRTNLMHRKDFTCLREVQTPPPLDSRQMALDLPIT